MNNGTAPYTYEWYKKATPNTIFATSKDLTNLDAGEYCVIIYDAKCCSAEQMLYNQKRLLRRYSPDDNDIVWDGNYKGVNANQGIYTYNICVKLRNGSTQHYKGDVLLLR